MKGSQINRAEMIKIVVLGDASVGKTSLLLSYTENRVLDDYIPTVLDNCTFFTEIDSKPVNLTFWDTAGNEEFERLRSLCYPETHVFLLCFSISYQVSFDNIQHRWAPEIQQYAEHAKTVLVGTKLDRRGSSKDKCVEKQDGEQLAAKIGAEAYLECSAVTRQGIKQVVEKAVRVHWGGKDSPIASNHTSRIVSPSSPRNSSSSHSSGGHQSKCVIL
eukprot:TRINITY_DN3273_c0_g1_i1.p1 TRINITY_DN3273_c0_g1~~TRINITY_DN3273_c0_g1_i1.p1  ORF type:complete len:217 (-),score=39.49 TRINITY_DN3273_c0_g1_i1:125-775(-)